MNLTFSSELALQNPFAKYPHLQRTFAKVKSFAKPFCKGECENSDKRQYLQGFALWQNPFAKPFAKLSKPLFFALWQNSPPVYKTGVLQRCKRAGAV
ncbi:MAG: hypothetical protein JJU29_01135 [Verrucomicrobia bacterium]|nr:hypothetical protein [Verrucomicrobiota bacterium]MCH8510489.1 hypothetical protein [Kiritimatiellia bacterium]